MMMRIASLLLLTTALTMACSRTEAAQLSNAKVVDTDATSGLEKTLGKIVSTSLKAVWIAWDVPSSEPEAQMCCFSSIEDGQKSHWQNGSCSLDDSNSFFSNHGGSHSVAPVQKKRDSFTIFVRASNRVIDRLRTFSTDCPVDAGGLTVHRVPGVDAADSVNYLTRLLDTIGEQAGAKKEDEAQHVISAIAMIRAPNAMPALTAIVRSDRDDEVRAHAAFWLGMRGGDEGRRVLLGILDSTTSEDLHEQAIAGIAQDDSLAATDTLLSLAKRHKNVEVRKHAIFWLGQKAGEKATADLREAADDPDEEVREMAVFSISQLPKDRAVPELIQLARSHKSKIVRERAIFWLGQSGDPKALDFIEEVLTKK